MFGAAVSILVTPTKTMVVVTNAVAASRIRWPACSLSNVPPTAVVLNSKGPSVASVWMAEVGAVGSCAALTLPAEAEHATFRGNKAPHVG